MVSPSALSSGVLPSLIFSFTSAPLVLPSRILNFFLELYLCPTTNVNRYKDMFRSCAMGRLEFSAATAQKRPARSYWSNKVISITVAAPIEASLMPHLWDKIQ